VRMLARVTKNRVKDLSPKVQGFLRKANLRRVSRSLRRGRKA